MTETVQVAEGLRNTSKGNLKYHEKGFEEIHSELNKFIYLSIQPSTCSEYEEGNKEKVASTGNSSAKKEKTKINDAHKSCQIPDYTFANCYAEVEQERIKYDLRLKEFVKKQVADKKRSWEKHKQLCKENEDKRELLRKEKEELDKSRESANNCIQVTEEISQDLPELTKPPEQETELKIKESVQNGISISDETDDTIIKTSQSQLETDERHLMCRRELEEALNELNSTLSMIIHKSHSHPQYAIQEIDNSIQFLKNVSENIQRTIDSNEKVVPSDVEMALSHLSISKQVLQFLTDIPVEKEPVTSSEAESREDIAVRGTSPEHTDEQFVTNNDIISDNVLSSQEEIDTSPSFVPNRSTDVIHEHAAPSHTSSVMPHISAPTITMPAAVDLVDKPTVLQSSAVSLSQPSSQPVPEVEIQDISEKKIEVEEMDSLPASPTSVYEDNYSENALSEYVPREGLKKYLALEMLLKKWKTCFEVVVTSPEWKKKRLDLQKAINTPINCISVLSGTHLLDKIQRLSKFLSGKDVQVAGQTISITIAPEAKYFCMDLLAKKLVSQGENQVSSCHKDAFPLAVATVHLWQQFPDFGMLFMAYIHQKCPYLVPYYMPRQENQTDQEYYKSLGYTYSDGIIEKQHQFLKRMTGIVRLYAAVIQTQPISKKPHPHGVGHGWMWLAHIMNLEPRPDITATVLLDFLEVCGYALKKAYGKQFDKLLLTLAEEFIPKIRKTSAGLGGPLVRLESFIKEVLQKGFISPPVGVITDDFWRT